MNDQTIGTEGGRGLHFERPELLAERLAGHLREAIIRGELPPGQRLVEYQMAKQWGVSRAPLREALHLLGAEGLISLSPHRGATVTPVSPEELEDLFALREMFEAYAARIAAGRATGEDLARMRELVAQMEVSIARRDVARYYTLAVEFHDVLMRASGNAVLVRLYNVVKRQFRRYQAVMARLPQLPERAIAEHKRILRAVETHRADEAASMVTRHILNAAEAFRRHEEDAGPVAAAGRASMPARRVSRRDGASAVKTAGETKR
jgi:DNA-binding GntR family transcriptional regulator